MGVGSMLDFLGGEAIGTLFLAGFAAGFLVAAIIRFITSIVKTVKRIMHGRG